MSRKFTLFYNKTNKKQQKSVYFAKYTEQNVFFFVPVQRWMVAETSKK